MPLDITKPDSLLGVLGKHLAKQIHEQVIHVFILEVVIISVGVDVLSLVQGRNGWGSRGMHRLEAATRNVHLLSGDLAEHLELILGQEWNAGVEEAVKRHTQRPHVNLFRHLGLLTVDIGIAQLRSEKGRGSYRLGQFEVVIKVLSF